MSAGHAETDHDWARGVSAPATLIGLAALLVGVYSALAALSFRFGPESVPVERPVLLMLGLLGIAFFVYLLSIRVALNSREGMPLLAIILLASILMRGVSLFSWPILEVDINRYIWDGAVTLEWVSPYRYSPGQVLGAEPHEHLPKDLRCLVELRGGSASLQTILSRIHHRELPTIYPPVSQAAFVAAVFVTPSDAGVLAHTVVMKAILVLFDLATLIILLGFFRIVNWHAGWAVAYGWCPLVIKETANTGHLDSVAVFFTTLALYFVLKPLASGNRGRIGRVQTIIASAAFSLAVGAKLYPIVLAPMFIWLWRRTLGWAWAAVASAAFFAVTTLVLWPMVPVKELGLRADAGQASAGNLVPSLPTDVTGFEPQNPSGGLKAFLRRWEMNDFLFLIVFENIRPHIDVEPARRPWFSITPESWKAQLVSVFSRWLAAERAEAAFALTRLATGAVFVVIAVWLLSAVRSSDSPAIWLRVAFLTLAWFWLLSPTQNPWYWTWALPLAVFARSRVWLAVSGLTMIYYLRFWLGDHWPEQPVPGTTHAGAELFDFVVTWIEYGPWFLCLMWVGIRGSRKWDCRFVRQPTDRRMDDANHNTLGPARFTLEPVLVDRVLPSPDALAQESQKRGAPIVNLQQTARKWGQSTRRSLWLVLTISSVCVVASPVRALTIRLTYDEAQSQPPSFDPVGTRLGAVMAAAAAQWEDIIEDEWSLDLAYTWGDLGNDGTRGVATVLDTSDGKPASARVRFDTADAEIEHTWYFDPTPNDHDEYNLPQALFGDLSGAEQAAWFRGSVPELFEVSFAGLADDSAPRAAQDGFDLLSVVMHEIGHTLGFSGVVGGSETTDLDFDLDSALIGGGRAAILVSNDRDRGHLAAARTLMFPSFVTGIRRLPSQTDILALASAADWRNIDLPRKDLLRGPSWTLAENWIGNRLPDENDSVFLRNGDIVTLDAEAAAQSLVVAEDTVLRTGSFQLNVSDSISIDGRGTGAAPGIHVQEGGRLEAQTAELLGGGQLEISQGVVNVHGPFRLDSASRVIGAGTLILTDIRNDGTLRAASGTLQIRATQQADLDGELDQGALEAIDGSIHLGDVSESVRFRGDVRIGANRELRFDRFGLQLEGGDGGGQIDFSGGSYVAPEFVQGGVLRVGGSSALINSNSQFRDGGRSRLEADLLLAGSAVIHPNASLEGPGQLVVTEGTDLVLRGGTVIGVGVVNHGAMSTVNSPASVTLASYRQTQSGSLTLMAAGSRPGTEHDQLTILGKAELGGSLFVDLASELGTRSGTVDTLTILTGSGIRGQFDDEPTRHQGDGLFVDVLYEEDAVALELFQAIPGDANGDRQVDQLDIIQVLTAGKYLTEQAADWTEGDWAAGQNGRDGRFDQRDLLAALQAGGYSDDNNFSSQVPAATDAAPLFSPRVGISISEPGRFVTPVPEPSGVVLLTVGVVFFIGRTRDTQTISCMTTGRCPWEG